MDPNPPKRLRRTTDHGDGTGGGEEEEERAVDVSIIMPVFNASCWLDECLQAVLRQDFLGSMELSVFDDASTDDSRTVVEGWRTRLEERGVSVVISGHDSPQPRGGFPNMVLPYSHKFIHGEPPHPGPRSHGD